MKKKFVIIAIDEAGRGPLAGPLAVAGVATSILLSAQKIKLRKKTNFENRTAPDIAFGEVKGGRGCGRAKFVKQVLGISDFQNLVFLNNIKDSKKLSAKQRKEWAKILCDNFECRTALVGPKIIDKIGISKATRLAVSRVLWKFHRLHRPRASVNKDFLILLDGGMSAPRHYNQKTIIKGDEKVALIAAASIIAKTTRDAKMMRLHKKFPCYCFDKHKGYATKLHYKMLKKLGFCPIHRRSFCK